MTQEIRAEMVATVLRVEVAPGDAVAEGETLLMLESMKMEIPVLAEADGTVTELPATAGAVVREGDLLAVTKVLHT